MAYKIIYKQSIEKDLRKIPQEAVKKAFNIIEKILSKNPFQGIQLKGKYKELWRYRFGDYRIIYSIDKKNRSILILRIRHRKNIYCILL